MPPTPPPGSAARTGYWAALAAAGAGAIGALVNPLAGGLVLALFLSVAFGIRRQGAWPAITGVCFLLAPIPIAATHVPAGQTVGFTAACLFQIALSFFLAQAAIELWHDPANRHPLPWAPLAAVFVVFWMVFQPFAVSSASMENTLLIGDQILVDTATWRLGRTPELGQIVVVQSPLDRKQRFIKRVVAGPGDRIRIRDRQLYRNGDPVEEPYAIHRDTAPDPYRDNFPSPSPIQLAVAAEDMLRYHVHDGELLVPDGKYFVLGDNRDDSVDSRYFGLITASEVAGSPLLVYGSYDPARRAAFGDSVRNLRWNRLGKLLR
jgi:signal peptidase I